MGSLTKTQLISIFGAMILAVGLYFTPKTASISPDIEISVESDLLEDAIKEVLSGKESPMKAILKIRELADTDESNPSANLALGVFSVMSNQLEKASNRFSDFGTEYELDVRKNAERRVAKVLEQTGDLENIVGLINKFKSTTNDEKLIVLLEEVITEFKNI